MRRTNSKLILHKRLKASVFVLVLSILFGFLFGCETDPKSASTTSSIAISTAAELQAIDDTGKDASASYYLTKDIDLDETLLGGKWEPLFSESNPFKGILQGNNYTIKNISIAGRLEDTDRGTYQGLFAALDSAKIYNLTLEVKNIEGRSIVGALAGNAKNAVVLIDIRVKPTSTSTTTDSIVATGDKINIASQSYLGGLIGVLGNVTSEGGTTIFTEIRGYNEGLKVVGTGGHTTGGLIGLVRGGYVVGSSSGEVVGNGNLGGLIGENAGYVVGLSTANITNDLIDYSGSPEVYPYVSVNVGGLVGANTANGRVLGYAKGEVRGVSNVGGLVGFNDGKGGVVGYATGKVIGYSEKIGGLVGASNYGVVGYAMGEVVGDNSVSAIKLNIIKVGKIGGLIGSHNGIYESEYKDYTAIGYSTGKITATTSSFVDVDKIGGLVGENNGNIIGYSVSKIFLDSVTGTNVGGLIGYVSDDDTIKAPNVGHWDHIQSGYNSSARRSRDAFEYQSNTLFTVLNCSTSQLQYSKGKYLSGGSVPMFTDPATGHFDISHGAQKTWPKLLFNDSFFNFDQPTVSDTNNDNTLEITTIDDSIFKLP